MENILKKMAVMKTFLVLMPPNRGDADRYRKFHYLSQVLRITKFSSYSVFVQRNSIYIYSF